MMMNRIVVPLAALLVLSFGCGGKGPDDPITGTWGNDRCYGDTTMPSDIESCKLSIKFDRDLTVLIIDNRQSRPAAAVNPRCIANRAITGLKYSTSQGTLTLSGTTTSTLERKSCANAADNLSPTADTRDTVSQGNHAYTIVDKTLSIKSGDLAGDFTLQ